MISAIAILGLLKHAQPQTAPKIPCMLSLTISDRNAVSNARFCALAIGGQYLTCRRHDKRSPRPGVICRARGLRTCSRPPPSASSSVSTPAVAHCSQLQGHCIKGYGGSGRPHTTRRTNGEAADSTALHMGGMYALRLLIFCRVAENATGTVS